MPSEIPEPGDRAIVMWTNGHGVPAAVYTRLDNYAYVIPGVEDDETQRWYCADERGEERYRWGDLCQHMNRTGWSGPFPLNVGELVEGGSNA